MCTSLAAVEEESKIRWGRALAHAALPASEAVKARASEYRMSERQ